MIGLVRQKIPLRFKLRLRHNRIVKKFREAQSGSGGDARDLNAPVPERPRGRLQVLNIVAPIKWLAE
jgi:hypothetical protein